MANIFDFKSYKAFLNEICKNERGALTRLSDAAPCQKSYLSACLKGKGNITLDHAFGIGEYLELSEEEQNYFFLLLDKERAGTPKLRRHLEDRLKSLSREAYRLKNQQQATHILSQESGMFFYYANWLATAIHTLTSIGEFQSPESISKRLQIPVDTIRFVLLDLAKQDFVIEQKGKYRWNSGNLHLADTSHWISNHHMNWRLRAIDNCNKRDGDASHYTAIQSLSLEDFEILKRKIATFIKEFNKVSDPSPSEEAFCFSIDLFRI